MSGPDDIPELTPEWFRAAVRPHQATLQRDDHLLLMNDMSAAKNLSDVLRAVADRVERGESFPSALRKVASELEDEAKRVPMWHLALIDDALADNDDIDEPWDVSLGLIRDELARK